MHALTARRLKTLALTLVAGVTGIAVLAGPGAAAIPAPPAGFTLTWSDDFNGAAGTGVDTGTWKYDTGPGQQLRHRRDRDHDQQHRQRLPGRRRPPGAAGAALRHRPAAPAGPPAGSRPRRPTFGAPAGGVVRMESSIQQPNVTTANGARLLAGVLDARRAAAHRASPGRPPARSTSSRTSTAAARSSARCTAAPTRAARATSRPASAAASAPAPAARPAYHTYAVRDRPLGVAGADPLVPRRQRTTSPSTPTGWTRRPGPTRSTTRSSSSTTWRWAAASRTRSAAAQRRDRLRRPDEHRLRRRVQQGAGRRPRPRRPNIAQGKPTTASSTENAGTPAANATDGNTGTRWSSAFSDPQWIQVDLGQSYDDHAR